MIIPSPWIPQAWDSVVDVAYIAAALGESIAKVKHAASVAMDDLQLKLLDKIYHQCHMWGKSIHVDCNLWSILAIFWLVLYEVCSQIVNLVCGTIILLSVL